jgi:hypothetical protein
MDIDGYPEQHELDAIGNWDIKDAFNLIDYIKERWTYNDSFRMKWDKDKLFNKPVLLLEMHTVGWSGNESIINALLENQFFSMMWYKKWERGGHYYFEVNPLGIGYKKVAEMAKEKGVSRQCIHKNKESYDWIIAGDRNRMCRSKK